MKKNNYILTNILTAAIIIAIYQYFIQKQKHFLIGTRENFKKLSDYVAILENEYKNQKQLFLDASKKWQNEKKHLLGQIKIISEKHFTVSQKNLLQQEVELKNESSDLYFKDGPPVANIRLQNNKIFYKFYDFKIVVDSIISRDFNGGKYKILTKAFWVSLDEKSDWFNKPFRLEIENGTALIDPSETQYLDFKRFFWGLFSIDFGMAAAVIDGSINVLPAFGLSFLGWGASKNNLDVKFLQLMVLLEQHRLFRYIMVSPAAFRIFPKIFQNTFLGVGLIVPYNSPTINLTVGL